MSVKKNTYITAEEIIKNVLSVYECGRGIVYILPTLKKIYDWQNTGKLIGSIDYETVESIQNTIKAFAKDKIYSGFINLLQQLLRAGTEDTPESKLFLKNFNFINSIFIDINSAMSFLNNTDIITDEVLKLYILRTIITAYSDGVIAKKGDNKITTARQMAAKMATQSPVAGLSDFRVYLRLLNAGEREEALINLERKITELINLELSKSVPNKKQLAMYIRIVQESTEKTYANTHYSPAVQEEKLKAAQQKFNLDNILKAGIKSTVNQKKTPQELSEKKDKVVMKTPSINIKEQKNNADLLEHYQIMLNQMEQKNKQLKETLSEYEQRLSCKENLINRLKERLDRANQATLNSSEKEQMEKRIKELENNIASTEKDLIDTKVQLEYKNQENKELKNVLSDLKRQLDELQTSANFANFWKKVQQLVKNLKQR